MRLEQLRYLIALSKHPSLSSAAETLHISHQALSAAIKALEKELDAQLVERNYAGVTLTADGQYLVKAAKEFCRKLQRFEKTDNADKSHLRGSLRIVSSKMALEGLLAKILANFYGEYPHVAVTTLSLKPQDVIAHYANSQADLAFLALYREEASDGPFLPEGIVFKPCLKLTPCIEIAKTEPLAKQKYVTSVQLKRCCIVYNCGPEVVEDPLNRWPFTYIKGRRDVYEPNRSIYLEMLRNGYGIGISTLFRGKPTSWSSEDLAYVPLRDSGGYYLGYAWKDEVSMSAAATAFLNHIRQYYPEQD